MDDYWKRKFFLDLTGGWFLLEECAVVSP